ncbi:MAG: sigma-70 family RNA polymerase sigma factor [Acidobacteriia bacterium]|nr:sigma-70 family RNA polymerase sigma factor [Terriglobia bacterium]
MAEKAELVEFEQAVLPHLSAAYNLARWLTGNDHDAEDVVQESYLRALKFFSGFRGGNSRPWLLTIVRNTCYTWLRRNRMDDQTEELDEEMHAIDSGSPNPEAVLLAAAHRDLVQRALEDLPAALREIVILREMEGMSYKEIADVTAVPIGTVMSRLARARARLQQLLAGANPAGARA